jgi:uncharacterized membrane protein (UPF0127 family)
MRINLKDFKICKSTLSKAIGLMFSKPRNLVFAFGREEKISLHTFFVFFPIDIIFLDEKKRVIERAQMRPFTFYTSKEKARYVVEIPSINSGKHNNIRLKDTIIFQ